MMVVEFPLIRWKMFETYLADVDEAVEQINWGFIHQQHVIFS
jgi:hypothetical protein